ncbi:MAG: hypothetical protein AB7O24_01555 [Kofleriaceae bacterium]
MMRRGAIAALIAAATLVPMLVLGGDGPVAGESSDGVEWMTPREKEAFAILDKNKPISARRLAEQAIAEDADSIVGHYVLGRVLHEAEGDLARAIYHLGHARELYEQRFSSSDPEAGPWKFHRELLLAIATLAGELEEYDYQLEMLRYHDALYRPARPGEQAWPLMKLGRIGEARDVADQASKLKDPAQRSLGLNTLCAIERAGNDRAAARAACVAAFDHASAIDAQLPALDVEHRSSLAVHAYNAALAARGDFAPEEAERLAKAGTKRLAFTPANPWRFLVGFYLDQGRGSDAANALREMHRWRVRQPPQLRHQDRAENDVVVASVMLVTGRTEAAVRLVDRAIEFPDRRGLESTSGWQTRAAHALIRRAIRRAHHQVLREAASVADEPGPGWLDGERDRLRTLSDDELIRGVLEDNDRLVDTFRLFGERGITSIPVWLLGDLVDVLGPGVVAVVLRSAREQDNTKPFEPYWLAVEAEVHLARGRADQALAVVERALAALPPSEALLRARVTAVAAEAAAELGDEAANLSYLVHAYQLDPSVIRRRGLALPARISGGPGTDELVAMLRRSPRFVASDRGFVVDVTQAVGGYQICLRTPEGSALRCAPEEPKLPPAGKDGKPGEPMSPARAAELVYQTLFAMPLGLTGTDMSSLDGSTSVSEQATRDQVDQMLQELSRE